MSVQIQYSMMPLKVHDISITLAMLANPSMSIVEGRKFLAKVAENADESGYISVEKFLSNHSIEKWKTLLAYPASVKESTLARVFDELFYGPELFKKQNHFEPKHSVRGRPLINNDKLAVSAKTMKKLNELFEGNLAIVSGRSRLAAEYSLSSVMRYFNMDACVFLEDEKREYAKPSPYGIRKAMQIMDAKSAVYAGDSKEDLLMVRRAGKEMGTKIAFVGIYGCSPQPAKTRAIFNHEGVEAVAKSINQLPTIIGSPSMKS